MLRVRLLIVAIPLLWLASAAGAEPPPVITISMDATGAAQVSATVNLPGSPAAVHAVLTDYARWPALFPHGLRLANITRENDRVFTDLYIRRYFLPGELHLITVTRDIGPERLETSMVSGDFLKYHRIWTLRPGMHEGETHAVLQLEVQPKEFIPAWVFSWILKQEILEHFEKLREAVQSTATH